MFPNVVLALSLAVAVGAAGLSVAQDRKPDQVIEVVSNDGRLAFVEQGKTKPEETGVVVGKVVRWINRDRKPHAITSVTEVEGKPAVQTEAIPAGEHRDLKIDNTLYRKLGGK